MVTSKILKLLPIFISIIFIKHSCAGYTFRRVSQSENEQIQANCQNYEFKQPIYAENGTSQRRKVMHGANVSPGTFPWAAAIVHPDYKESGYSSAAFCGATIISPRHLISARHCLIEALSLSNVSAIRVYVGGVCTDVDEASNCPQVDMQERIIEFAAYQTLPFGIQNAGLRLSGMETDLAIIQLTEDLDLSGSITIKFACLPHKEPIEPGQPAPLMNVYGWGFTEKKDNSPHLKVVELPLIQQNDPYWNDEKCKSSKLYCMRIADSAKDGAIGDSGSGIVGMYGPLARFYGISIASMAPIDPSTSLPLVPGNIGLRTIAYEYDFCKYTGVCAKREWEAAFNAEQVELNPNESFLKKGPEDKPEYYQYTTIFDPTRIQN